MCNNDNQKYQSDIEVIDSDAEFKDLLRLMDEINEAENPKQKEITHTVALDWTTISFLKTLPDPKELQAVTITNGKYIINPECYLVHLDRSLNGFNNACSLFIHDIYVGKLLYNPINELDRKTVHLIIDNRLFYQDGIVKYINYLIFNLNFRLQHLVRLDIANDYTKHDIYGFYTKLDRSPNIRMKGKAIINERKRTNRKLEYLVVGSPNSDKRITCYNKTKDLENNPKPYIQDKWTAERLDYINNKVERNELRLQTSELKNIDYKQLDNREYLLSICRLHYKNFFEFTRKFKQNGKYVNKDVTPIDITFSDYNTVCLTRSKHVPSDNIIAAKGYLHKLYNSSLTEQMIQDNETDLNLINPEHLDINMLMIERHLVLFPQLVPYFERKKTTWDTEYRQKNIMYYANTDKMINDSIRIIPPVIEQEQQNNSSINKKDTDMFEMNDRLDQKVMNKMIANESEAIKAKPLIELDSNLKGKITDTNIDNIYKTYQTYITLEDKNKKLSFNQFFKVVIFCTILESKSYKLSDINKFIVDNDSEMYANNMNALIKLIIKDKLDVNGDIQLTQ